VTALLTFVLGAPGAGKSAVAPLLRESLRTQVVVDWDALMAAASELAGHDVRRSPTTWPAYDHLMRAVVEAVMPSPLVVLGVRTPDELEDWPIDAWVLFDCSDTERRRRLGSCRHSAEVEEALVDACGYRVLGLPVIDTTGRTPDDVAADLARLVRDRQHAKGSRQNDGEPNAGP
jgi:broad-specificity NMP kinase